MKCIINSNQHLITFNRSKLTMSGFAMYYYTCKNFAFTITGEICFVATCYYYNNDFNSFFKNCRTIS